MIKKQRPFLKWAGGKYQLLDRLMGALPPGKRLIEPFVGSGVVFLNSHYPKYLLNDINPDLINLYQTIQKYGEDYINDASLLFIKQNNQESSYYQLRDRFNASADPYERSLLFLYMNRHGYNGLCRYNQSGGFNVPFGRYVKPVFPEAALRHFLHVSKKVKFSCDDFLAVIKKAKTGDVVYCDPPYAPLSVTSNFTSYAKQGFTLADQNALVDAAIAASKRGATVVISNHDTKQTRNYYRDAEINQFSVKRTISADPKRRQPVPELLAVYSPQ